MIFLVHPSVLFGEDFAYGLRLLWCFTLSLRLLMAHSMMSVKVKMNGRKNMKTNYFKFWGLGANLALLLGVLRRQPQVRDAVVPEGRAHAVEERVPLHAGEKRCGQPGDLGGVGGARVGTFEVGLCKENACVHQVGGHERESLCSSLVAPYGAGGAVDECRGEATAIAGKLEAGSSATQGPKRQQDLFLGFCARYPAPGVCHTFKRSPEPRLAGTTLRKRLLAGREVEVHASDVDTRLAVSC